MSKQIYMDYQATTPVDQQVADAMIPWLVEKFGNAASKNHSYGWEAEEAVDRSRGEVADVIGARPGEIIWTSGATESDNLALKGAMDMYRDKGRHMITCVTEHKAVLDSARWLEKQGCEVTYLPVDTMGMIDLDQLRDEIREDTVLVSLMSANNETGVLHPIGEIGGIVREKRSLLHVDAAQGYGKVPLDVESMNIDLMSISAHKIYGPKGIGALYVRRRNPRVRLAAQIHGGGHERGMRSGTLPVSLCVGLGAAARLCGEEMEGEAVRLSALRDGFISRLMSELPEVTLNGHAIDRLPGNANLSFAYVEGESLMMGVREVAVSSGSACTSASLEPSYILKAMGTEEELAHSSIRFGFGRFTTEEEVNHAADLVIANTRRLREMSPLWEMAQQGVDLKSVEWTDH